MSKSLEFWRLCRKKVGVQTHEIIVLTNLSSESELTDRALEKTVECCTCPIRPDQDMRTAISLLSSSTGAPPSLSPFQSLGLLACST